MYTKDYQHYFLFSSIFPLRSTPDYFLFDKKIRGENYFKIVRIEQQKNDPRIPCFCCFV